MRDKRIWFVIGCILVIGIAITSYTSSYIKEPVKEAAAAQEIEPQSVLKEGAAAKMTGGPEKEAEAAKAAAVPEKDAETAKIAVAPDEKAETADAVPETAETNAEIAAVAYESEAAAQSVQKEVQAADSASADAADAGENVYVQRLKNLDAQLQKMREEDANSNVYSIRTSADTELKLWESEMNTVYNGLLSELSKEDAVTLAREQQEWLKNRDGRASELSAKGNSATETISYTAALVSLTRDRAYALAEKYQETSP